MIGSTRFWFVDGERVRKWVKNSTIGTLSAIFGPLFLDAILLIKSINGSMQSTFLVAIELLLLLLLLLLESTATMHIFFFLLISKELI